MQIILLERVEKLGQMGDIVQVRPGYARNFLLPKAKALRATKQNLEDFATKRKELEAVNLKRRDEAVKLAARLESMTVTVIRQAGETGNLYGSVSAKDVADAMAVVGCKAERSQVAIPAPIKTIGVHAVRVILHPEVSQSILVSVAKTDEEAKAQIDAHKASTKPAKAPVEAKTEAEVPTETNE